MRILQREREGLGWSRAELARKAGMNAGTVGQIESGYIGKPYPAQLTRIADALNWAGDPSALLEEVDHGRD